MEKLARNLSLESYSIADFQCPEEIGFQKNLSSHSIQKIAFPLESAVLPLRRLSECFELMGVEQPEFNDFEMLAQLTGPYLVSNFLKKRLANYGVVTGKNGELPYTAPVDYFENKKYLLLSKKVWSVEGIRNFSLKNSLQLHGIVIAPEDIFFWKLILETDANLTCWQALHAFEILVSHKTITLNLCLTH